jgi:hypothetical protein
MLEAACRKVKSEEKPGWIRVTALGE